MTFRAHELLSVLKKETDDYRDCMSAIKFDLGDIDTAMDLSAASKKEFLELPAPLCLFQVTQETDVHLFLAKQLDGCVEWTRFGRQLNDGLEWHQEDLRVRISKSGDVSATTISSVESVDTSKELSGFDPLNPSSSIGWTILSSCVIASAIEVFSCCNIELIDQEPPKFINSQRIKKGKVPFFSYKTLHITGESAESGDELGGTHASPRLHLRRGHIRRLADGRRVWVRSCLVGDKSLGFVGHEYKVRMAA